MLFINLTRFKMTYFCYFFQESFLRRLLSFCFCLTSGLYASRTWKPRKSCKRPKPWQTLYMVQSAKTGKIFFGLRRKSLSNFWLVTKLREQRLHGALNTKKKITFTKAVQKMHKQQEPTTATSSGRGENLIFRVTTRYLVIKNKKIIMHANK